MTANPLLRLAKPCDASSLAALSIEVWLGTYLRRGVTGVFADFALTEFTPERFKTLIDNPNEWLLVSQNVEGIDGYIRITNAVAGAIKGCGNTEISTFYVQPRHHGKGIGKALLTKALDQCRALGAESVWLTTNSENTPAIAFYEAMGFVQIGTTPFHIDNEAYDNTVFSYDLRTPDNGPKP